MNCNTPSYLKYIVSLGLLINIFEPVSAQQKDIKVSTIAHNAWANNSANTVIFRKNALVTFKGVQYASFYDSAQYVVLAKRLVGSSTWQTQRTPYTGDATDAHKSISLMIDGGGVVHVAWGQHNNALNYAKGLKPGSLELGPKLGMTGNKENKLSYPEFYRLANGNLIFLYRDGGSGNGNLIINHYNIQTGKWNRLQDNLIDGEGQRNAYWQLATDKAGTIHLSWVWRETPDVASNHDLAYACSKDGGITWQKSTGELYKLPITAATAEYACKIPQKSELINQTSMFADDKGNPFIATYWREENSQIPQYHLVYKSGNKWKVSNLAFRKSAFSLSGQGSKSIPIARPQIIAWQNKGTLAAGLIFRDAERGSKVSIAVCNNLQQAAWKVIDLTDYSVGAWEPTLDTELWKDKYLLNLFVQKVTQVDGEGLAHEKPEAVQVLQWQPQSNKK
ncbi:BNR repeat-containing protein [Mucilaginibacter sp. CSA2-8R]|uniref:BNR repeat-containing protein n=1 Tax=Mucilaginibacter sp. CSA2-8R TaxID=3141542 RepID=UPI00315D6EA4